MKTKNEKPKAVTGQPGTKSESGLRLRKARKLQADEALKELVTTKRVLPACESSCACSTSDFSADARS